MVCFFFEGLHLAGSSFDFLRLTNYILFIVFTLLSVYRDVLEIL